MFKVKINDVHALSGNSDFTLSNDIILPNDISLSQNYPNPFNPETQINFSISNPSNIFQYPESGVESLVPGKKYVWQILRSFETTNGVNEELSQIFIFKMQDATQMQTYSSSYDVALDNIKELIGESIFNQLFSQDGELYNYNTVSSTITVNGEEFPNNHIIELIEMLNNNQINIIDVNAE